MEAPRPHKKILVLRFGSLGDVVLATAVLRALRRIYPGAKIHAGVKQAYASLLVGHPCVDELLVLDTKSEHRGFSGLWSYLLRARDLRFDLVVDLHSNARSRLVSFLSGARVLRARKHWLRRQLLVWFKRRPSPPLPGVARRYLEALRPLAPGGFAPGDETPELRVPALDEAWARRFLKEQGLRGGETLVGVNPGAAWPTKRWNGRGFAAVLDALAARGGVRFLLIGDRHDVFACEEAVARARRAAPLCIQTAGETSVGQMAALLKHCRLLLTNDSGPMHVAVGLGVPVVALFGPTVREFGFAPLGPRDRVVERNLSCRPCSLHGGERCPIGTHECMEGITPEAVLKEALAVLGARRGRSGG